jgi:succinate-semialdehyde dehydrogenase / glutarate-semialdehyde dehydrogenase
MTMASVTFEREQELLARTPTALFLDGRWTEAASGARFPVTDPATGAVLAEVADATPADGVRALAAAHAAQGAWAGTAPAPAPRSCAGPSSCSTPEWRTSPC